MKNTIIYYIIIIIITVDLNSAVRSQLQRRIFIAEAVCKSLPSLGFGEH